MNETKDFEIITTLRGFAALSVFFFHLICLSNNYISNIILRNIFMYGKYGVEIFFVISGFVITYSMLKADFRPRYFPTFLKKRIIRLEPPYLIVLLITIIIILLRNSIGLTTIKPTISQVLLHLGYLIPFSNYDWLSIVFWTLAIEFQFYLLYSLIFSFYNKNKLWGAIIASTILLTSFVIKKPIFFFYWSPIFLLGINLAFLKFEKISTLEYILSGIIILTIIYFRMGLEIFLFSFIPCILIYYELKITNRIWTFFGNISYSLYLSHTLIAFTVINLGIRYSKTFPQKIFFVSTAIALTILFSYLLFYFIEKPSKKIASSIKYQKTSLLQGKVQ